MAEYNYKLFYKENGTWKRIKTALIPFYLTHTLDESLDSGKINLQATRRKTVIPPFTPIRIETDCTYPIKNAKGEWERNEMGKYLLNETISGEPIYMLVANDFCAQITPDSTTEPVYYNHVLELIEPTKLLERHICDTMTFTNSISKLYSEINEDAIRNTNSSDMEYIARDKTSYKRYYATGSSLTIKSVKNAFSLVAGASFDNQLKGSIDVFKNGVPIMSLGEYQQDDIVLEEGTYEIRYSFTIWHTPGSSLLHIYYTFECINDRVAPKPYTITDVIERILSAGETRRDGVDSQAFTLDSVLADRYRKIDAPEFHITRSTFFEALLQVGNFIHAIPRLVWNPITDKPDIVTFDELGGNDEYIVPDYCIKNYDTKGQSIEDNAGYLDSTMENAINSISPLEGSVTSGYQTMRSESVMIDNDTACVLTEFPIYRVTKIEMGYVENGKFVGDLTPFLYETAEYQSLSSYNASFPYSKAYALEYTQGTNAIKGFTYRVPDAIMPSRPPTLTNILSKLGHTAGKFKDYAFKVDYIPISGGRIRQYKPSTIGFDNSLGLISNQVANTVENGYYGEFLKGQIARLGNITRKVNYYYKRVNKVPRVGQKFEGKYISAVELQFDLTCIKSTMTLTPNYNRLSNFVGLNSNYRLYEISEKQSIDRQMNYSTVITIGQEEKSRNTGVSPIGALLFAMTFTKIFPSTQQVDGVVLLLKNKNKEQVGKKLYIPCTSMSFGNSMTFTFQFLDNYGAGYRARKLYKKDIEEARNVRELVRVGDEFGNYEYMDIDFVSNANDLPSFDYQKNSLPFTAPEMETDVALTSIIELRDIKVQKDSRERIIFTHQIHHQVNDESMVLGQALASFNGLVLPTGEMRGRKIQLVLLPEKLNMLHKLIDITNAHIVLDELNVDSVEYDEEINNIKFLAQQNTSSNTYNAWAVIDANSGQLYFGQNKTIAPNEYTSDVYFNF